MSHEPVFTAEFMSLADEEIGALKDRLAAAMAERDETRAFAVECFLWLQELVQCRWSEGDLEKVTALIRRMLTLPWLDQRLDAVPDDWHHKG